MINGENRRKNKRTPTKICRLFYTFCFSVFYFYTFTLTFYFCMYFTLL
ncbi:unnamed protein product [Arabidopsis halleri]